MEGQDQINQTSKDRLQGLFALQIVLQTRLGNYPLPAEKRREHYNEMTLALIDELMEALRETNWKSWKKSGKYNKAACQKELIDAWHFLINLSIAADMTADDVYEMFIDKNNENHLRQDGGY